MKRILLTIIMLSAVWLTAQSQTDVVIGNAKTYAGDTLTMYAIDDYITRHETPIATADADSHRRRR